MYNFQYSKYRIWCYVPSKDLQGILDFIGTENDILEPLKLRWHDASFHGGRAMQSPKATNCVSRSANHPWCCYIWINTYTIFRGMNIHKSQLFYHVHQGDMAMSPNGRLGRLRHLFVSWNAPPGVQNLEGDGSVHWKSRHLGFEKKRASVKKTDIPCRCCYCLIKH